MAAEQDEGGFQESLLGDCGVGYGDSDLGYLYAKGIRSVGEWGTPRLWIVAKKVGTRGIESQFFF